jgi:predicted nucleic acid-binding protein
MPHAAVAYSSLGFPEEIFGSYTNHGGLLADNVAAFLAYRNGKPVAIAMTIVTGVEELELGEGAPARLATLRAETGRKLPDCCVLAAAQQHGGSVASFDDGLRKAARKLGLRSRE